MPDALPLTGLSGGARWAVLAVGSLASAALLIAAGPPHDVWPLAFVALVPLLLAARARGPGAAALLGVLCGAAVNFIALGWTAPLLERFAALPAPVAVAAHLGLSLCQGLVFGLWVGLSRALALIRVPWLVSAPLAIVCAETSMRFVFEWPLGVVLWRAWPLAQLVELGGPAALSALVVALNLLVVEWLLARRERRALGAAPRVAGAAAALVLVLGLCRASHVALARDPARSLRVGLVQPNRGVISPEERAARGEDLLAELVRSTEGLGAQGARLVVWPETAFPFLVDRSLTREYAAGHPWSLRGGYAGTLLFGALSHEFGPATTAFNSAMLVSAEGSFVGRYDKRRLMPLGEYVPFRSRFPDWAGRVERALPKMPPLAMGRGPTVLSEPGLGLKLGVFICYEDLSAGAGAARAADGAELLVTLANHAWFDGSAAAEQARALAVLRGIEARRDVIRATATGTSSVSDALGRVRQELRYEPGAPATLLAEVHPSSLFTLGAHTVPYFPSACRAALVMAALLGLWRTVRRRSQRAP